MKVAGQILQQNSLSEEGQYVSIRLTAGLYVKAISVIGS